MRIVSWMWASLALLACGGDRPDGASEPDAAASADDCTEAGCAAGCTPEAQEIEGDRLELTAIGLDLSAAQCPTRLVSSADELADVLPEDAASRIEVDFAVDRVVLGASNPTLVFAVDDGDRLVVGEETLCQGAAPRCVAYVVHGTARDSLRVAACPYLGPEPCLAP
jgi:hypothetical protein